MLPDRPSGPCTEPSSDMTKLLRTQPRSTGAGYRYSSTRSVSPRVRAAPPSGLKISCTAPSLHAIRRSLVCTASVERASRARNRWSREDHLARWKGSSLALGVVQVRASQGRRRRDTGSYPDRGERREVRAWAARSVKRFGFHGTRAHEIVDLSVLDELQQTPLLPPGDRSQHVL